MILSKINVKKLLKRRLLLALVVISLIFFRYDFVFSLYSYAVAPYDTFWSILNTKVFHDNAVTGLSLQYLETTNPKFNFDKILKNQNGEGGYTISIFLNKLRVVAPDKSILLDSSQLFPSSYLVSHALQVLVHNIIIFSLVFFLYTSIRANNFRLNLEYFKSTFSIPIIIGLGIPITLFLLFLMLILVTRPFI